MKSLNWIRPAGLLVIVLGAGLLFGGCGQKGPLYLPDDNAAKQEERQQDSKREQISR